MTADESTQRHWEIAEKIGMPVSDEIKFRETLRDEFARVSSSPEAYAVINLLLYWRSTRNPYYLDQAVILCGRLGIFTEAVHTEIVDCATRRINGSLKGTNEKTEKEKDLSWHFNFMLNLRFRQRGIAIGKAAELAVSAFFTGFPKKKPSMASTIERYYSERYKHDIEPALFESWEQHRERASAEERAKYQQDDDTWLQLFESTPPCPEHLKGDRR